MPTVYAAVKAIIRNNGKFLIIKEKINNQIIWDLPGGKIKYKESPEETLLREVKEETGLDIKIISLLGLYWFFKIADKKQAVCSTFICQAKNIEVDLSKNPAKDEKIIDYRWVTKEEFLNGRYPTGHKSLKELIKKYIG